MVSVDDDDYDQTKAYMKGNEQSRENRFDDEEEESDEDQRSPDVLKIAAAGIAVNKINENKYRSQRLDTETKGDMINEIQGNAIENVRVKTKSECK